MNKVLFSVLIIATFTSCSKTIYIVRHAEKAAIKTDPLLTAEGEARAAQLKYDLRKKKLDVVYSTNTSRTVWTAIRATNGAKAITTNGYKKPVIYNNDTVQKVLANIAQKKQNALVVGHSNTILPMLKAMGITPTKTDVPDWEYDNLFVVKYKKYCFDCTNKFVIKKVLYKKYGNTSKPPDTEAKPAINTMQKEG